MTFPGETNSIMRMGLFREIYEGEVENARVVDYKIWKMSLSKQLELLEMYLKSDADNIILFIPGARFRKYIPGKLVKELKRKNDLSLTVCCYLVDGIERQAVNHKISIEECRAMFDCFDIVYSYDIYESQKYGFVYENLPLKKFKEEELGISVEKVGYETCPVIFFCGRAKGRLPLILEIADSLDQRNIQYEFLILREEETRDMKNRGGVRYIDYLGYDEVIKHVNRASCLLSLVAENNNMTTASYNEAIMYNKKLLTNCKFLSDNPHYDSRYMRSFQTVNDIDFDWITDCEEINYGYNGYFSAGAFLKHIEADYRRGLLRQCSVLNKASIKKGEATLKISVHFSHIGWIDDCENAQEIVYPEQMEALRLNNIPLDMGINIEIRQKFGGYSKTIQNGETLFAGSVGKSDPIMAFRINAENPNYKIVYRAYLSNLGWTRYYELSNWCGTGIENDRMVMRGVQIIMVKKSTEKHEHIFGGGYRYLTENKRKEITIENPSYTYLERWCA